jgi:hypothetical protein
MLDEIGSREPQEGHQDGADEGLILS